MRANEFLSEGRKPFSDLKSWTNYAKAQGLSVKRSSDPDWSYYAADKDGNVRGKFVSTHASQNSRGYINEGLKDPKDNPCWKGYKPVGTKKKAGKTVPNCVPVKEFTELEKAIMEGGHALVEPYNEIEFVCVNNKFPNATDPVIQRNLYNKLRNIPGVIPNLQDWGDGQRSLTAIYKDRAVRSKILSAAGELGAKVDLEQPVSDDYVDRAIRGEHEGQIVKEADGVIRLSGPDPRAKAWIDKVYELYPYTWQNNHVMSWGKGPEQEIAMFELEPSKSRKGAVEIYWFQAYPLRKGVGSRAMAELQRLAREDGIALTLYPWDKGQVSQAKLMKFYKALGYKPTSKGSKNMYWDPNES